MTDTDRLHADITEWLSSRKGHLIGAESVLGTGRDAIKAVNPSTGEQIGEITDGTRDDVDAAVSVARHTFQTQWRHATAAARREVLLAIAGTLDRHGDELRRIDALDMGMPLSRPGGVSFAVNLFKFYAGQAENICGETISTAPGMHTYTVREPVGVVGVIIPWNGPVAQLSMKVAPALAAGCCVVVKPAEDASLSTLRFGELLAETGLPTGAFNVVTGRGDVVGEALSAHPDIDKLSFTGSTATGVRVAQNSVRTMTRTTLELGGKSPDIVCADADLDIAVAGAAMGVFSNSGQICHAGSRIFVARSICEEFTDRLVAYASSLTLGDSLDPRTQLGPLASRRQYDKVTALIDLGVRESAELRTDPGAVSGTDPGGFFISPTVFSQVRDEAVIAREEIFGPVAVVMPFDDLDEVVMRANATQYGLGAGVWTRDVRTVHRLVGGLRAGTVWVNTYGNLHPAMPFGGVKMSGQGRDLGAEAVNSYTEVKSVWINYQ